jgi:hypothetical protein
MKQSTVLWVDGANIGAVSTVLWVYGANIGAVSTVLQVIRR